MKTTENMLSIEAIEALEARGFSRWQKGAYDRLYINARDLGLVCSYYKTGSIKAAEFRGEEISNSQGYRYKAAKTYIDVTTGKVHSDFDELEDAAQEILDEVLAAC